MSEHVTGFLTDQGVKKYDYNHLANLPKNNKDASNTVISPNADYAEVGEWVDGNPNEENRLGYFVAIAEVGDNTVKIQKATSTDVIRGVSVNNPAFSGNASDEKYNNGELLPKYNYIAVMGIVEVIDNGLCSVNGRCMPADDGTAIPSSNNMGYAVLKRVNATRVLIAVEPGADMIQRVKTDIDNLQITGGGLTVDQLNKFNKIVAWYESLNYRPMTLSISPLAKTYEIGSFNTFALSWTFSEDVSSVTINGAMQTATKQGSKTIEIGHNPINPDDPRDKDIKYTVAGTRKDGNQESKSAHCTISFRNRLYYGFATDPRTTGGTITGDFIRTLQNGFASGRNTNFDITCASGTYIWYAYPKRYGEANFSMAPKGSTMYFNGGFEAPETVSVTNNSGFTEEY